ncbi:MAG TPA: hypothetical protein PKJ13_00185 [bacterium]|nr:hypothetical protein [bacterium]
MEIVQMHFKRKILLLPLFIGLPLLAQEEMTLQQGRGSYNGCQDAHILANKPDWNTGAEEGLEATGNGGEADAKHVLLRFDLSSLPAESRIDSAWIELYLVLRRTPQIAAKTLAVYRLNRPWNEGSGEDIGGYDGRLAAGGEVCWSHAALPDSPWSVPGANGVPDDHAALPESELSIDPVEPAGRWFAWRVTGMTQFWVAQPDSNFGLLLREPAVSPGSGILNFASSRFAADSLRPRLRLSLASQSPQTTALTMTAEAASGAITVHWPCRGDADGDAAAEIALARAGDAQWGARQRMNKSGSGYDYTFTGLAFGRYHLRGWISDPDGIQGEAVQTLLNIELSPKSSRAGELYTALRSDNSLQVELTFSDDGNADNSALLEHKPASSLSWQQDGPMSRSPGRFSRLLTGLSGGQSWDLRVTLRDPDGVSGDSIFSAQLYIPPDTGPVRLLGSGRRSFEIQSGDFTALYDSARTGSALWLTSSRSRQYVVRNTIANGLPFAVLDPALIDSIAIAADGECGCIQASLYGHWGSVHQQVIITAFTGHPGLFRWQCLLSGAEAITIQNGAAECSFYDRERGYSVSSNVLSWVQQAPFAAGLTSGHDPLALQGSLLYFQNFTALNDYFALQRAAPQECVRLTSTGFGFERPGGNRPLRSEPTVITDAWLYLTSGVPATESARAERFISSLAAIYARIDKPAPEESDWKEIAGRMLADLDDERCLSTVNGQRFLRSYVGVPRLDNAEAITQLDVLVALRRYEQVHGEVSTLDDHLAENLWQFYNLRLNTMVNDAPNAGVYEGDSWYALHIHLGLARLARMGDGSARTLLFLSLPKLMRFARAVNYDFPVFFRYTDDSAISGHEYDVTGGYAYLMLDAWQLSGDESYLQEAKLAAEHVAGHGFDYIYEAHITAATCAAMARLFQITGESRWLELSYMPFANLMAISWLWECDYGYAAEYRTFFGLSPMTGAGVITPMEQHQSWSYLREYRQLAAASLPAGLLQLLDGFIALTPAVMKYTLPPWLPAAALVTGPTIYDSWNVPAFHIPLEDLREGWQKSGSLGQQIYGAGAPLVFAAELTTGIEAFDAEPQLPQMMLLENHPNPFNAATRISWRLPEGGRGEKAGYTLTIYDILGRKVRALPVNQSPGRGDALWDGRDDAAAAVSGGVYLIVLEGGSQRLVHKVLLLR